MSKATITAEHGPAPAGLMRIDDAAKLANVTVDVLAYACEQGQIPVELLRLGGRQTRFVRAAEMLTFLKSSVPATKEQ